MVITSKIKLVIQTTAATLVVALAAIGVAQATTIGTNISTSAITSDSSLTVAGATTLQAAASITSTTNPQLTIKYDSTNYWSEGVSATGAVTFTRYGSALQNGFTLADTVAIATSTAQTILTVNSTSTANASTTLAVYQAGSGDILNLYDGSTAVFTVKDGGTVGVASSTPWGLLAVEQSTETRSFVVGNSGSSTPSFVINGVNGDGRVGIGVASPSSALHVQNAVSPQLTLAYDSSNYYTTGASSTGVITFTRYGSALQNGFTLADTVAIATSTAQTILTVNSTSTTNASTTLAVYQAGSGDILNLYDGGTAVFTVLDGGKIGVSSSTPFALLSVNSSAGVDPFVVGSSTATTFIVDRNQNIGVATTSPWGLLSVELGTETNSLVVANTGSTTPSFIIKGVNGDGRVGIGTSTPGAMFAVGDGSAATTTFDFAKPCFRVTASDGTSLYYSISSVGTLGGWATSTTSCF